MPHKKIIVFLLAAVLIAAAGKGILTPEQNNSPTTPAIKIRVPCAVHEGGQSSSETYKLDVEATAYTWTGNRTRTGTWPEKGVIAVDPDVIPLGSEVYVPGYGWATAEDTGSAIQGKRIDVYLPSRKAALRWGRKDLTVKIKEAD